MRLELGDARRAPLRAVDPRRYHEAADPKRPPIVGRPPVCIYLEVTNRCNLLCATCPRTYETLEPPADMSWDLFTRIVAQVPDLARAVLHGVGEPMLVKSLPAMVSHLKERGVYVLFNTNGTALSERNGRALIGARLDELRVSLDAATREKFRIVRGIDLFNRILANVRRFRALQAREGEASPRVSLWLTGLKETLAELPAFVRLAADTGVGEVYLQRLVFFDADPVGLARPDQTLFERLEKEEAAILAEAEAEARRLGVAFSASGGASEPGLSLASRARENPWSLCGRPWTLMYVTATGRALPCCVAPFSQHGYANFTLGDATRDSLEAIWNGARYQAFRAALQSDRPPRPCANCGLRWSL
jgi:MoaA/NifB/PqqE/SkfB family radical SAM enzyme